MRLANKQIVLGVTGGIAAYKSADLVRRLKEAGALVRVVMTQGAKEFITPLTMQALSGYPVHDEMFDLQAEAAMGHIELARWADVILVAPATADFMAQLAHGEAGDLLSTLCVATKSPVAIAPSMNQAMWKNTATQQNLQILRDRNIDIFGPAEGDQACGDIGPGRMLEPLELVEKVSSLFETGSLSGKKVVITAGPTREPIDPVRYISNASSGKMGYALALAAAEAGADVILISGPVQLACPRGVKRISVVTAEEMHDAVMTHISHSDIFIGVAAVADYRLENIAKQKIPKTENNTLTLVLHRNPDIVANVAELQAKPYTIGFAAETHDVLHHAKAKLKRKKLDMIIANAALESIDQDENEVTVLWEESTKSQSFPKMSKFKLARALIELISEQFIY